MKNQIIVTLGPRQVRGVGDLPNIYDLIYVENGEYLFHLHSLNKLEIKECLGHEGFEVILENPSY